MIIRDVTQINWYGDGCIGCACEDLQKDIERICGQSPPVVQKGSFETHTITAGSMEDAEFSSIVRKSGLPVPCGWEQYTLRIGENRILIAGSDPRGTMWGIYRISSLLGIPAGIRFSEQVTEPCELLPDGHYTLKPFTFRFRGWFLNDEDLLTQWHYGDMRELDYPFYQHITTLDSLEYVVETALRMNINLLIPASFLDICDPNQEKLVAYCVKRGLFISQHHIEPLGVGHWYYQDYMKRLGRDTVFSYVTHKENAEAAWRHYAEKWAVYKEHVIWQLGLRGRGDVPVWKNDSTNQSLKEWGNTISEAIQTQYDIVEEFCGPDFYSTCTLWMEGAQLYNKGYLRFPAKTMLVFSDIGPTQMMARDFYEVQREERRGYGIYYHICFQGDGPHLCQGTDWRKMEYNYGLFVRNGETEYSILNVSNVREFILSIEANARLTAHFDEFEVSSFCRKICRTYYGNEQAAEILSDYFDAFAAVPENETDEKYRTYFSFLHGEYEFLYCPATDGYLKSLALDGLLGTAKEYWPGKLEESIRKLDAVLKKAEGLTCYSYFQELIRQIRYMIYLESWCLGCISYGLTKKKTELATAVSYLDRILLLQKEAEQGVWKNWYRGDAKIGIRQLRERTHHLLQNETEKELGE